MSRANNVMDNVFDHLKELDKGLTQLLSLEKSLPVPYLTLTTMPTNGDALFTFIATLNL